MIFTLPCANGSEDEGCFSRLFVVNLSVESPRSDLDFPKIFEELCLGNLAAYEFCLAFLMWVHFIDDAIDCDQAWNDPEQVIKVNLQAAMVFAFNTFWNEHKKSLLPLIIQGSSAFADSNDWALRGEKRERQAADVLKAQYQEVFWHVAYLIGGYDHLDRITTKYRNYHFDAA